MIEYITSILSTKNEFRADFECSINNIIRSSKYVGNKNRSGIKIDTGAANILIPLKTLGWLDEDIDKLKLDYVKNHRVF